MIELYGAGRVFWTAIAFLVLAYNLCDLVDRMQARRKPDRLVLVVAGLAVSLAVSGLMLTALWMSWAMGWPLL